MHRLKASLAWGRHNDPHEMLLLLVGPALAALRTGEELPLGITQFFKVRLRWGAIIAITVSGFMGFILHEQQKHCPVDPLTMACHVSPTFKLFVTT